MRVSKFYGFLTAADPVLAPYTRGKVKLTGKHTLTCHAPTFTGTKPKITFRWGVPRYKHQLIQQQPHPIAPIKGATKKTYTRTGRQKVACEVTAANASGKWTVYSPSVAG
jgi:hypothetical protein